MHVEPHPQGDLRIIPCRLVLVVMPVSCATDTLSALREKIEQQKKAVQATAAQVDALASGTTTAKFYPLPEG